MNPDLKVPADTASMRGRIAEFDWSRTPLGPITDWPASLQTAVDLCLNAKLPMFVWWGPELINIYNDAYITVLGKKHPQALGQPARQIWSEIWPLIGDDVQGVVDRGVPILKERVPLTLERNGYPEQTYFTYSHSPIYDERHNIRGLFQVCIEETARVNAESDRDRLAEQRQFALDQSRTVLESISDAFFAVDRNWRFSYVNPQAEKMLDRKPGDLIGKLIWDVYPGLFGSEFEKMYRRVVKEQVAATVTSYYPDHLRWYEAHAYPAADGGISIYFRDVTQRTEAENTLRETVEKYERQGRLFEQIASTTPDFIYVFDLDGRFLYANRRLLEVWGTTLEQAIGKNLYQLNYPQWHADMHMRELRQVIQTRQSIRGEVSYTGGSGIFGVYEYIFTPVLDPDGNVEVIAGTTRDVTERKRAEAERETLLASEQTARTEAERASQMKDEFLATLSHELRTPLNAILGWATILSSGTPAGDDLRDGLETIQRNARAQTQIIEDLLDMSRIISGKVRLEVQRIDLSQILQAAIETVRPTADAKGVRLRSVLDPHAGPVTGDPNRLQQVFWNLLTNAVKFTPKSGQIQVLLERVNSHVEVTIIDTGEGISPEFLAHVFDRFRQADASTTRRHGGLGLGLAIVKQLVELHGGSVRVKSPGLGQGSTFTVELPLTIIHPETEPPEPQRRHPDGAGSHRNAEECMRLTGIKVLVVDDEPDARALVKRLLSDCDAVVNVAGSAQEAMKLIAEEKPDVLVSDIGMPGEDGYSLIRRIRALGPANGGNMPAIALTAYARTDDRIRAIRAGFQTHVVKPVDPIELITVVASLAGLTQAE